MSNKDSLIPGYHKFTDEERRKGVETRMRNAKEKKEKKERMKTFFEVAEEQLQKKATVNNEEVTLEELAFIKFIRKLDGNENIKINEYVNALKFINEIRDRSHKEAQLEKIKAETEYIKAQTAKLNGDDTDIEDLSELDKMFDD